MTRFFAIAAFFLFLVGNGCSSRGAIKPTKAQPITQHTAMRSIEDIINNADPNVNIGISIRSLNDNKVIYQKNADRHFVPCSTIKVVTLAAALHYLGPSYRFVTKIFADENIKADGSVNNIYVQGGGDPSLMDYDLVKLAQELAQRGVKKIHGDIIVDDQIFDDVLWGRGDMWDDRSKGYAAPVAGINVNYNRQQLKIVPGAARGAAAHAVLWPHTHYVNVVSEAKTVDSGNNITITLERGKERQNDWPQAIHDGLRQGDKIIVKGQVGKNSDGHYTTIAINDPGMFAATILKEELHRHGVKLGGKLSRKAVPIKAVKLAHHESRSLAEALIDFTKVSNNVGHDTLVKAIAANSGVKPATATAGLKLVGEFLQKEVGINANSLVTADGAGLSRYSLITPDQMVKLLDYTANHFHMGAEFMAALSFAGEDGLLRSRMRNENVRGYVRAKSGTMTSLSNLVGFFTDQNGERYAFAIMINGFIGSTAPYVAMQDRILTSLLGGDQTAIANAK